MSTKLKALALSLAALFGASTMTPVALAAPTAPVTTNLASNQIGGTCTQWQIDQGLCEEGLRALILKMINWVLWFLGLVATGFLIFGGFLYVTSGGNDDGVNKAKKLITYAAIGIVVILLAAVLVNALIDMVDSDGTDYPGS